MSAQDVGNLADYILNGDNYQRVLPDGSTLIIPGQRGRPPMAPVSDKDTYRPLIGDCPTGSCALFVHDIFTGFYYIERIATFDAQIESCLCALAGSFESPNCGSQLQAFVDSLLGKPLFETVPLWLITELGAPLDALFAPDFWFVGCYGDVIVIPNLIQNPTGSCPPPGKIQLVNGAPVCMFDPPIPNPLPRAFRKVPESHPGVRPISADRPDRAAIMRALNPTLRAGKPFVFKHCACSDDFVEENIT